MRSSLVKERLEINDISNRLRLHFASAILRNGLIVNRTCSHPSERQAQLRVFMLEDAKAKIYIVIGRIRWENYSGRIVASWLSKSRREWVRSC
jgi:hypothetical protein